MVEVEERGFNCWGHGEVEKPLEIQGNSTGDLSSPPPEEFESYPESRQIQGVSSKKLAPLFFPAIKQQSRDTKSGPF